MLISAHLTDTVSMSRGLTLPDERIVFLYRRTKVIRLLTFYAKRHLGGSEGRVWDGIAVAVGCIV